MKRINGVHFRFLRRTIGIKASHSKVSNHVVWRQTNFTRRPSYLLSEFQKKIMRQVFRAGMSNSLHNVVFNTASRDRIVIRGRHRGHKRPYWLQTTTQRYYPLLWSQHSRRGSRGRFSIYSEINRDEQHRAGANALRALARTAIAKKEALTLDTGGPSCS